MEELEFSKIVSVPKPLVWSQAYNAGKLFAVLSLEKELIDQENPDSTNILGKDLLSKLEEEFFTLDFKDLKSIKQAISNTFKDIDINVKYSFAAAFLSNKNLYIFTINNGTVFIIRDSKIAKLSASLKEDSKSIVGFFGNLKDKDLIILATNSIADVINQEKLSSLNEITPNQIADSLSPKVLEKDDGKTSIIITRYQESKREISQTTEPVIAKQNEESQDKPKEKINYFAFIKKIKNFNVFQKTRLTHSKKIILTLAVVVLAILVSSIYFAIQKQEESKIKALFNTTYVEAEKKYSEGNSLISLNKNLARENFIAAQKILEEVKPKLPKASYEEKQILELLKKVNNAIEDSSPEKIAKNQDKTQITIIIENGSGEAGVAGKTADFLKSKGYNVISTANADNYKYVGVTIKVKSSTGAYLDILKKDLSEEYNVTNTSSDLSQDSTADILVIIGK